MAPARKRLPKLGELELAVLELLWAEGEADVQQAHAAIGVPRGISLNTVGSALERLFRKGLLGREKVSHAYRYRPAIEREALVAARMIEAAGGSRMLREAGLLSAFVSLVASEDEASLDRLEALIARHRRRKGEQ